ncbi:MULTISPECIES: response regulator transcription factor [Arhodomonas]|nr:response regulator transcription factor [Arhodomonas aquaeolei]
MAQTERTLTIVEDDAGFARALKRSFERRDYRVHLASDIEETRRLLQTTRIGYAVVDLKLGNESGLEAVQAFHEHDPATRIVVLTGFASIATAVNAVKLGACNYLVKPSNTDDIEAAFSSTPDDVSTEAPSRTTSIKTLEWERIHETLMETGFNISETARRLGMHRRTLARKLEKRRVR